MPVGWQTFTFSNILSRAENFASVAPTIADDRTEEEEEEEVEVDHRQAEAKQSTFRKRKSTFGMSPRKLFRVSRAGWPRCCWFTFWRLQSNLGSYLDDLDSLIHSKSDSRHAHRIQFKAKLIILFLVMNFVRYIALSWLPMSDHARLLNFDVIALFLACPPGVNLMLAAFCVEGVYFFYLLYWTDRYRAGPLLLVKQVLIRGDDRFFLNRVIRTAKNGNSIEAVRLIRRYSSWNQAVLRYFVNFIFIVMVSVQILCGYHVYQQRAHFLALSAYQIIFQLLAILIGDFLFYATISCFAFINMTAAMLFFGITVILFVQLTQINQLLKWNKRSNWNLIFIQFRTRHTETLRILLASNALFGRMLLTFFAVFVAVNTYLVISIYNGLFAPFTMYVMGNVVAFQYFAMVCLHLLAIMYTARLYRSVPVLLHWNAATPESVTMDADSLGNQLRLANYIERFHSWNRYGITYGSLGLMTFASFGRCILLYCQLIMYWYMLFPGTG